MASQAETKRIPFDTISQTLEQGINGADPARASGLQNMHRLMGVKTKTLEREKARLSEKLGPRDPRVLALDERIESNRRLVRDLAVEVEHAGTQVPVVDKNTWVVHGFVRDNDLKGVPNLTVALYDPKGTWMQVVGYACTDEKGYFRLSFTRTVKTGDSEELVFSHVASGTVTRGSEVFIHVLDKGGVHIYVDKHPLTPQLGKVDYREIRLSAAGGGCTPPSVEGSKPPYGPGPGGDGNATGGGKGAGPDAWVVRGRVSDESGQGLGDLIVSVYDKDLLFDDRLGTTETDQNGNYRLVYRTHDFRDLIERKPDLYVKITDRNGHLRYTSEHAVKWNSGRTDTINVVLPPEGEKRSA